MKRILHPLISSLLLLIFSACNAEVSRYDLVWDTPSENASGSMPIGNGEVGANVWVEPNGDLVFYLSRTDSWSELGELYKLGRVRVSFSPSIVSGGDFSQRLDLVDGCIKLHGAGTDLSFWIDSEQPVIRIAGSSKEGVSITAKAEIWRDSKVLITREYALKGARSISRFPDGVEFYRYPDEILDFEDAVIVRHHNTFSSYDMTLDHQGIEIENRAAYDPYMDRCFGYRMEGKGLKKSSPLALSSEGAVKDIDMRIATDCGIYPNPDEWTAKVNEVASAASAIGKSLRRTAGYWNRFWKKSYIYVETPDGETGEKISRSYVLQSWMLACAGRGDYAIKFNGSIFNVDTRFTVPTHDASADVRFCAGEYWWQNTRLMYHPMLKSGDFDLMKPLFEHYFRNLPMMKANARALLGAEGAISLETQTVFGTHSIRDYGWDRSHCTDSLPDNNYIKRHWSSSLEMVSLMLDYYDYTGDKSFVRDKIVPYAREFLKFYDTAYKRNAEGTLVIEPTQSLETYWYDVVNDMPTVAGLNEIMPRLLALPAGLSDDSDKALWKHLATSLPDLPARVEDGVELFAPAESYNTHTENFENPELYPVFPYHLCNISTDNLQMGRNAFKRRIFKDNVGWTQSGQQAARLGLTEDAVEALLVKVNNSHPAFRFPAYWGPNYDWTPDQNHGGNMMTTLQDMVLQTYDGKDYILPAFPDDWGVKFKLFSVGGRKVKYQRSIK